ncbi:DUF99 family protein [Desulfonema magnum]|uniref:DUF99 n=1 Tax=Desulfonema magnum TaxID=45655 RepID=A0A975GMZ8_9BACT|nr:DUF99 family protein [Desulfonema magnum]QTA87222.1 DUF99 [Desulfonema magnum]
MPRHPFSNVIGFDDAPFPHSHRGNVTIVGTIYAGLRFDGVLMGHIRRDGANAAKNIARLVAESKFANHARLIMLQGIALGGFNVVDIHYLYRWLQMPVLVVARRRPNMPAIKEALLTKVPGGLRKWKLIKKTGPMEPILNVFVQRAGLTTDQAEQVIEKFAIHGHIPEPLRTAHLIAGGITSGESRGRA